MSMTQTTRKLSSSSKLHCPHCNTLLPPQATFCASCGERLVTKSVLSLLQDDASFTTRYRITSLVRRRPYVNLLFALDTKQSRPVAIRDIDISCLNTEERRQACEIVQQEYDQLRHLRIPSVMPAIDLRLSQGHLYLITGWPLTNQHKISHLSTLQDVLQSGIGLPDTPVSLGWGQQLCLSLDQLHRQHLILGDLDPQTLILGSDQYDGNIEIMIFWLPPALHALLPTTSDLHTTSNYSAPEVLLGKAKASSDIYSLGAILYILLTGVPPDEATARLHRRLRAPSEVNSHMHSSVDELVMKAMAIESTERFPNALAMAEALERQLNKKRSSHKASTPLPLTPIVEATTQSALVMQLQTDSRRVNEHTIDEIISADTIAVTPLPQNDLEVRHSPNSTNIPNTPETVNSPDTPQIVESSALVIGETLQPPSHPNIVEDIDFQSADEEDEDELPQWRFNNPDKAPDVLPKPTRSLRQRITGLLPAIPRSQSPRSAQLQQRPSLPAQSKTTPSQALAPRQPQAPMPLPNNLPGPSANKKPSFIEQLQGIFLGEQKHVTAAVAIIETPLRVQPQQIYSIRIQLLGRNDPFSMSNKRSPAGGLSTLTEGNIVHIEVRSALYQNYAYIVQQASVTIPASGFAAEVTIPMRPLSNGPSGRRDRLHIFFMDEHRHPLYEKPFVVELFISHLVQPGREGHNVLTIPL